MTRTLRRRGLKYAVSLWAATHLYWVWDFINRTDLLRALVNESIINRFVAAMEPRPARLSTMSDYTSWASLTDKTFSDRHLPPTARSYPPPDLGDVVELFKRRNGEREAKKSTLLFPFFAQWFVDGFLRTDPGNPLKNNSTHDIDLTQLYGSDPRVTDALRAHIDGRLKSQFLPRTDGVEEQYPPWYYDSHGNVKDEFRDVPIIVPDVKGPDPDAVQTHPTYHDPTQNNLFALGLPRGNIHYGTALMSTIFLREHNRLADLITVKEGWDDERTFQTARNTLIVMLIKVVIQDYINHITPFRFQFVCEPGTGALRDWFRPNWMSIEFDMLYRWHALVPDSIEMDGVNTDYKTLLWDMRTLIDHGVASLVDQASKQPSTEIGLFNTADFLITVEEATIQMGRDAHLAGYNDYRQACGYPRIDSFDDLSSDFGSDLKRVYKTTDAVELYPGLYAEDVETGGVLGDLMGTMVGVDAFSQALTNPLLDPRLFSAETFSRVGMAEIGVTNTLEDIVLRNIPPGLDPRVSFNRA
ncbi:MAG: peroxidase family protein [Solirubrobacteraceae bacterium]